MAQPSLTALALLIFSSTAAGAECEILPARWHAGEDTDLVVCADGLPTNARARAASTGLTLVYQQALKRCDVNDRRPGMHLVGRTQTPGEHSIAIEDEAGAGVCALTAKAEAPRQMPEYTWLDAMPPAEARHVNVNGIRTRYFERGQGRPVVLVHGGQAGGANNSAQKWEQNFAALAVTHRVIALDRLAQAGTDNLPAAADYADYFARDAEHFKAFLTELDLRDAILVGHSQGGWPVTRAALDMPGRVGCVVNVDTVLVPDNRELMSEALGFLMYESRMLHPAEGPTVASARRGMALRYPSGNNITLQKAQRVVDQYNDPKTVAARDGMKAARMTPLHPSFVTLRDAVFADIAAGRLSSRSVVIWGELDPQVPLAMGREFERLLVDAGADTTTIVIAGAGHAPFIEFPEAFNRAVLDGCEP